MGCCCCCCCCCCLFVPEIAAGVCCLVAVFAACDMCQPAAVWHNILLLMMLLVCQNAASDMCQLAAAWWQFGRKRGVRCVSSPQSSASPPRPLSFATLLDSWGRGGEKRAGESENERGIKGFLVDMDEFASVAVGVRCVSQCRIHTRWRGCERLNTGCGQIFSNINQIHNNLQVSVPNIQKYLQFTRSGEDMCTLGKTIHKYLSNILKISNNCFKPCAKYSHFTINVSIKH